MSPILWTSSSIIALYLETLRDPGKFRRAAFKAMAAGKPIVAFKVGRSEARVRSAVSHTGALAGADGMCDALFAQLGIIRAHIPAGD
jgi:acyl-CoA synthetase (NDP forming)